MNTRANSHEEEMRSKECGGCNTVEWDKIQEKEGNLQK